MKLIENLYIIIGISGAGKSSLARKSFLEQKLTCTTRPPRNGELHGKDYLFLSNTEFKNTSMLESTVYGKNSYGTPLDILYSNNKSVAIVLDVQGVIAIKEILNKKYPQINVFVTFMKINKKTIMANLIKDGYSKEAALDRYTRSDMSKDLLKLRNEKIDIDLTIENLNTALIEFEDFINDNEFEDFIKYIENTTNQKELWEYIYVVDKSIFEFDIQYYTKRNTLTNDLSNLTEGWKILHQIENNMKKYKKRRKRLGTSAVIVGNNDLRERLKNEL